MPPYVSWLQKRYNARIRRVRGLFRRWSSGRVFTRQARLIRDANVNHARRLNRARSGKYHHRIPKKYFVRR